MENMIKVRAMRAAGIACFFSVSYLSVDGFFTTPSGDIVNALSAAGKNGWRRCHLRDLYVSCLPACCRIYCLLFLEMGD